MRILSGE